MKEYKTLLALQKAFFLKSENRKYYIKRLS